MVDPIETSFLGGTKGHKNVFLGRAPDVILDTMGKGVMVDIGRVMWGSDDSTMGKEKDERGSTMGAWAERKDCVRFPSPTPKTTATDDIFFRLDDDEGRVDHLPQYMWKTEWGLESPSVEVK